jgi:hypothetical protein
MSKNGIKILRNLGITGTTLVIIIAVIELFFRFGASLLPMNLQNILLTKYNSRPDGIYFHDPEWDIPILKPNFQQNMFYNGYRWIHRSNNFGIRDNHNFDTADIVLLGDSMVYGHGVNADETSSRYLKDITGKVVANLGVQADYPPKQYIRLKHLVLFLRPKIVLFFINGEQDKFDFANYRPTISYINRIIREQPPDYSLGINSTQYFRNYENFDISANDHIGAYLYSARPILMIINKLKRGYFHKKSSYRGEALNKDIISVITKKILHDANRLCKDNGAKFVVIIHHDKHSSEHQYSYNDVVRETCKELGIPFIDLKEFSPKNEYFLKKDGHYSKNGNKWVAETIDNYLRKYVLF